MSNILEILEQMKKADRPRIEAERQPKQRVNKSSLTNKQQYLRQIMKGGKR